MRILVAPDSFKGSLTASEVAKYIRQGIHKYNSAIHVDSLPMSDGGDGMCEVLIQALSGSIRKVTTKDPLMRTVESSLGWIDGDTAIIEMASASGMSLLKNEERDLLRANTFGTGLLIKEALGKRCRKMILGLGGSATNDAGVGMAAALGYRFLDESGLELEPIPINFERISRIDKSKVDDRLFQCHIVAACDVENILTGPEGATMTYGEQKGGSRVELEELEQNMIHLQSILEHQLGTRLKDLRGGGAAGGLGAGVCAFLGGSLAKGFEVISDYLDLEEKIKMADLVITGEGKIDEQTSFGKTPFGVLKLAQKYGKPVIMAAGSIGSMDEFLKSAGYEIYQIKTTDITLRESMERAGENLETKTEEVIRNYLTRS